MGIFPRLLCKSKQYVFNKATGNGQNFQVLGGREKAAVLFEESYFKIWILMKDWIGYISSNDDFFEGLNNYIYGKKYFSNKSIFNAYAYIFLCLLYKYLCFNVFFKRLRNYEI